jgi:hypothetical protein
MSQETPEKALGHYVTAAAAFAEAYGRLHSDPRDPQRQQAVEDARAVLDTAARAYEEVLAATHGDTD